MNFSTQDLDRPDPSVNQERHYHYNRHAWWLPSGRTNQDLRSPGESGIALPCKFLWEDEHMLMRSMLGLAAILFGLPSVYAQTPDGGSAESKEVAEAPSGQAEESGWPPSPFSLRTYSDGDSWNRSHVTGDWNGKRTELAEQGITFEIDVVQIFQVNARGGRSTNNGFAYSGSADYRLTLDTTRLGWWPAGQIRLKAETQFGRSVNGKTGSIMSPNADALFPLPDEHTTTLSDVVWTQFLSEHFGFAVGKIDFRGGDANVFAHSETTQFMNLALLANPVLLSMAPYSALTAGLIFRPTEDLIVGVSVLDSLGRADTAGFDTAFHSPEATTFVNEWTWTVRPFGLSGHQRFGFAFSNRDRTVLNQDLRVGGPIRNISSLVRFLNDPENQTDDWAFYYNFDQFIYVEEEDFTQGIGLFGRFGWSDGEVNPIETFYSIGVGGKGIFEGRDEDTFGLGYYYLSMSDDMADFLDVKSEQGLELYYNIEVTPWMHITPDIQYIIDPGGGSARDSWVGGVRAHVSF
ncbi:MAG: carbohydrate porin [Planctomycetota bacterium]